MAIGEPGALDVGLREKVFQTQKAMNIVVCLVNYPHVYRSNLKCKLGAKFFDKELERDNVFGDILLASNTRGVP